MDELETLIRDLAVRSTGEENVARHEYFGERQCLESDSFQEIGAADGKVTTKIKIHVNSDGKRLHAFPCHH